MNPTLVLAVVVIISAAVTLVASVLQAWNIYRHPNLKPHPVINLKEASGRNQHGFRWVHIGPVSGIIPLMRTAEGAIWSGVSWGVSRENGKVAIIGINLYGAEQGAGHYTWRAHINSGGGIVGSGGHFNMDRLIGEEQRTRESRILRYAVDAASADVNINYRPLQFSIDEEKITKIYDSESGRFVFDNPDRKIPLDDLYIFGPPPMAHATVPYVQQPGVYINESFLPLEGLKRLKFSVWDIYEQPLDYAQIDLRSDSGYGYTYTLKSEDTNRGGITITVPTVLTTIHVLITRGGFHPIEEDITLKESVQRVDVFMEPKCVILGDTLHCTE